LRDGTGADFDDEAVETLLGHATILDDGVDADWINGRGATPRLTAMKLMMTTQKRLEGVLVTALGTTSSSYLHSESGVEKLVKWCLEKVVRRSQSR
jgi:hypothetical protein